MSVLNVNKIADASGGVLAPISSVMRNRIINGGMVVAQRGTSAVTTNGSFPVDRFKMNNTTDGTFSAQQSSTVPSSGGFVNSVLVTVTAADTSLTTTQRLALQQSIEGFNCADLAWGTASAKSVTISFWVRSSLTGTFSGSLRNSAGDRSYPYTYTISAANTWEQKSITVAGDTSGTWEKTNSEGIILFFSLGVGPSLSGTAGAWASAGYWGATGETPLVGTNGATFYITGVQLEVGTQATGFEYRQYGQELSLCQRYYETMGFGLLGVGNSSTGIWAQMIFKVQKRATPTVGLFTTTQTWKQFGVGDRTSSSVSIGDSADTNTWGSIARIEGFSSVGTNAPLGCATNTVFTLSAEL